MTEVDDKELISKTWPADLAQTSSCTDSNLHISRNEGSIRRFIQRHNVLERGGIQRCYFAMPDSRPFGLEWRSNTLFILSSVIIGLFSDIFLYSLFVPILPYMLEDRAAIPNEKVQVHVSGLLASYAGAAVLFSPVAGWIADRTSQRRTPFLCGLLALLAGTVSLYFARTEPVMIFARILQGLSSAVVWSVGLAVALDTVGPENMGKTMGTVR